MNVNYPPDPRYGVNAVLGTVGQPPQNVGADGDLAVDPDEGSLYIKSVDGWLFLGTGTEV